MYDLPQISNPHSHPLKESTLCPLPLAKVQGNQPTTSFFFFNCYMEDYHTCTNVPNQQSHGLGQPNNYFVFDRDRGKKISPLKQPFGQSFTLNFYKLRLWLYVSIHNQSNENVGCLLRVQVIL